MIQSFYRLQMKQQKKKTHVKIVSFALEFISNNKYMRDNCAYETTFRHHRLLAQVLLLTLPFQLGDFAISTCLLGH